MNAPITYSIIIGLSPAHECGANQHCMGAFMRTVCQISGLKYATYLQKFGRLNLFPEPVGKCVMPRLQECEEAAAVLVTGLISYFNRSYVHQRVRLLCAGNVTNGVIKSTIEDFKEIIPRNVEIYVDFIPHPSGRNRMLNNHEIKVQMGRKICEAAQESTSLPLSFYDAIYPSGDVSKFFQAPISTEPVDRGNHRG